MINKENIPKGWREGQTISNFLIWLDGEGEMADPFYIEDKELNKKFKQFLNEQK